MCNFGDGMMKWSALIKYAPFNFKSNKPIHEYSPDNR